MKIEQLSPNGAIVSLDDGRECRLSVDYEPLAGERWNVTVFADTFIWHPSGDSEINDRNLVLEVARFVAARISAKGDHLAVRILE